MEFGPILGPSGYLHVATSTDVIALGASSSSSSKKADSGAIAVAVVGSLLGTGMALLCGIIVVLSTGKKHDKAPAAGASATSNPMHAKH
jgi:hypothetical protein